MSFATTLSDAVTVVFRRAPPETQEEVAARAAEEADDRASPWPIEVHKVGLGELMPILRAGFEDLRELRTDTLTIAVIYPLCGLIVAGVIADRALLPFLFPACAGFALVGPLATLWYGRAEPRAGADA